MRDICRSRRSEAQSHVYKLKIQLHNTRTLTNERIHIKHVGEEGLWGRQRVRERWSKMKENELFEMKERRTYTSTNQPKALQDQALRMPLTVQLDYCALLLLR